MIRDYVANGDLPDYVKWTFLENMDDGRNSRLRSASDRELANTLRERFADLNWEDEKARQDLFEQYKKWMRPAYLEWFRAVGSKYADEELQNDINNFMKQYDKIKKTIENAGAAHVNIQI